MIDATSTHPDFIWKTVSEIRHLRLHRRSRRASKEDVRGSASPAAGGGSCRFLWLSPHGASRDAALDDAVAQHFSRCSRAGDQTNPARDSALSPSALSPAAAA